MSNLPAHTQGPFTDIPLSPASSSDASYVKIPSPPRPHITFSQTLSAPVYPPRQPSPLSHDAFHAAAAMHTPPIRWDSVALTLEDPCDADDADDEENEDEEVEGTHSVEASSSDDDPWSAADLAERGELPPATTTTARKNYVEEFRAMTISARHRFHQNNDDRPFSLQHVQPLTRSLTYFAVAKAAADLNKPLPTINDPISPLALPSPRYRFEKPLPPLPLPSDEEVQEVEEEVEKMVEEEKGKLAMGSGCSSPRTADTLDDYPSWGTLPFRSPPGEHRRLAPAIAGFVPASFSVPVRCRRGIPDLKIRIPTSNHNRIPEAPGSRPQYHGEVLRRPEAAYLGYLDEKQIVREEAGWENDEGSRALEEGFYQEGRHFHFAGRIQPVLVRGEQKRKSWMEGVGEWIEEFVNGGKE